jgi:YhhN-like protein.
VNLQIHFQTTAYIMFFLLSFLIGAGYFIMKWANLGKRSILLKCAASGLPLLCAMIYSSSSKTPLYTNMMVWFALFCVISDALLEIHFITGMFSFAAAHVCLIIWILGQNKLHMSTFLIWAILAGTALILFRKEMTSLKEKALPFVIYACVLSGVPSLALPLAIFKNSSFLLLGIGTLCFYVSDLFVAAEYFRERKKWHGVFLMILYWAALYSITFYAGF